MELQFMASLMPTNQMGDSHKRLVGYAHTAGRPLTAT